MSAQVEILLATYNSQPYLKDTIESILNQEYRDWRLLVSDGDSTDATHKIIEKYTQKHPEIVFIPSKKPLSACENFSRLLEDSSSDYVMFCDHDDIWHPDKISKTLVTMKRAEEQYGTDMPLLVFTDTKVVDEKLRILSGSNLKYQNLDPQKIDFNRLLLQNVPSGCTMMMNRALVNLCKPIPVNAVMHDHWVSLVAAAFGKILFLGEPTMLYRQHNSNYYGASQYGWGHFLLRYRQGMDTVKERLYQYVDQASAFNDRYAQSLHPQHRRMLAEFSQWRQLSWLGRRRVLLKYKILKTGFRRNLGMFLIV